VKRLFVTASFLVSSLLSGCVLNLLEPSENANRIFDNSATIPTPEKNFTGFVQVGDNIEASRVTAWMEKRCGEIWGGSYTLGNRWKGTAGPHSTPNYYNCIPKQSAQISTPQPSGASSTQPLSGPNLGQADAIDFTVQKKKCIELGFIEGTEGFGKCVMQLSR